MPGGADPEGFWKSRISRLGIVSGTSAVLKRGRPPPTVQSRAEISLPEAPGSGHGWKSIQLGSLVD